jgi:hypothetical protein
MNKKMYLSCSDIYKGLYQENLSKRYSLVYTSIHEAEVMCVPVKEDSLTRQQAKDLMHATELGLDIRVVDSSKLLDKHIEDVLSMGKKKQIKRSLDLEAEL